MRLFKYENYKLMVSPEAYTIKAFKELVDRDTSDTKEKAMKELAFIYFTYDPRSEFQYEVDEADRIDLVKEQLGIRKNWNPDKKVLKAIETYKGLTITTSSRLLESERKAIDRLIKSLEELDIAKEGKDGKPIYSIVQITNTLKSIPSLVKEISTTERAVISEIEELGRIRGDKSKKVTDDGIDYLFANED